MDTYCPAEENIMNRLVALFALLFAALSVSAQTNGVPPGPPSVEIGNTVDVNVVNTLENPVPVLPPVAPPWRGTPTAIADVVLQLNPTGFQRCELSYEAQPGKVLLLHTVSGTFNVDPQEQFGSMSIRIAFPPADGQNLTFTSISIPAGPTAPASQVAGLFDAYSGSLTLPGLPVVAVESCVSGVDAALGMNLIGYEVDAPFEQ
jgi:hypothetical protein